MSSELLQRAASQVLAEYSLPGQSAIEFLGNAGGFSGARLWRVRTFAGSFCLKAWPGESMTPERLTRIHSWMEAARASLLAFVPAVIHGRDGRSVGLCQERTWDLTEWMPGTADFQGRPSTARIEDACSALASLHVRWNRLEKEFAAPSSLQRRLAALAEWRTLLRDGWRPAFATRQLGPVTAMAKTACELLPGWLPGLENSLRRWAERRFALHPCLCDVWHDHVLFDGDYVTGIIDYGAMRLDHPAADLARLLGSMAGDDEPLYSAGLAAYRRCTPLSAVDELLVRLLDRTGTILAAGNWLLWLYRDGRQFPDHAAVARRFGTVVKRIEGWRQDGLASQFFDFRR